MSVFDRRCSCELLFEVSFRSVFKQSVPAFRCTHLHLLPSHSSTKQRPTCVKLSETYLGPSRALGFVQVLRTRSFASQRPSTTPVPSQQSVTSLRVSRIRSCALSPTALWKTWSVTVTRHVCANKTQRRQRRWLGLRRQSVSLVSRLLQSWSVHEQNTVCVFHTYLVCSGLSELFIWSKPNVNAPPDHNPDQRTKISASKAEIVKSFSFVLF